MAEEQLGESVDPFSDAKVITGRVKWFNTAKGFGFVTTDEDVGDVFVHLSSLRKAGHQTLHEGMLLKCKIVQGPKGLQAVEIIEIEKDNEEEILPNTNDEEEIIPEGDFNDATVKWFNVDKGYGFITLGPETTDIFIHIKTMQRSNIEILIPGQIVKVKIGQGPKGPQVACIELNK